MADDDIAHAVGDEVDLLDAVEIVDQPAERFGVVGHVVLGGRILDVEDLIAPPFVQILAEPGHRRPAAPQAVQHDHAFAGHRRQMAFVFDALQHREAMVEGARGVPPVPLVQQAAVFGMHFPLNPPLVKEELVGPELFSPQGRHGKLIGFVHLVLLARQPL